MNHPYKKHDLLLGRDLTNAERLQPAVATLDRAALLIGQFRRDVQNASDLLSEEQLEIIGKAADVILRASENATFLGWQSFDPWPLESVKWE